MLYIVSTPIGNLLDITLRAIETLKTVNIILCEDTRVSKVLLNAHGIYTPLISYHSFNERSRLEDVLDKLKSGQSLALISDAGTPLFQDPGFILIEACQKENIPYTTLPGPSSILSALILSGFNLTKFQFIGFLPKKQGEIRTVLEEIKNYEGLSVFFESPRRVLDTLEIMQLIDPNLEISIIREITKKFETVHKGTPQKLIDEFTLTPPRGEIVFVVQGRKEDKTVDYTSLALELIAIGIPKKTAYTLISKMGPVDKDFLYKN